MIFFTQRGKGELYFNGIIYIPKRAKGGRPIIFKLSDSKRKEYKFLVYKNLHFLDIVEKNIDSSEYEELQNETMVSILIDNHNRYINDSIDKLSYKDMDKDSVIRHMYENIRLDQNGVLLYPEITERRYYSYRLLCDEEGILLYEY